MSEAVVTLEVKTGGAIKSLQMSESEFKKLEAAAQKAGVAVTDVFTPARASASGFEAELRKATAQLEGGLIRSLAQAKGAAAVFGRAMEEAVTDEERQKFARLRHETDLLGNSMMRSTGTNRSAEQSLLSLGFALNDAQQFSYGFAQGVRGISNNLPGLITGLAGVEGGVKGLWTAIKGPSGVLLALNAVLTAAAILGPKLEEAFGSGSEAAKRLKEAAQDAFDAITTFDLGLPGVTINRENIGQVISGTQFQIQGLEEAQRFFTQGHSVFDIDQASFGAQQAIRQVLDQQKEIRIVDRNVVTEQLGIERERLEKLKEQQRVLEQQAQTIEVLLQRGAQPSRSGSGSTGTGGGSRTPILSRSIPSLARFGGTRGPARTEFNIAGLEGLSPERLQELAQQIRTIPPVAAQAGEEIETSMLGWINNNQDKIQQFAQVAQQAFGALGQYLQGQHQARMQEIATQKNADLDAIAARLEADNLSESQRTSLLAQRAKIEDKYRKEENAEKRKAAKRDRDLQLFEIAINTASAVVEALPNVPLSIAVGVLGAIQEGIVLATPIPKFAKGGVMGSTGMALVGEQGPELVRLPGGSRVFDNRTSERMLAIDYDRLGASVAKAIEAHPPQIVARAANAALDRYGSLYSGIGGTK